MAAAVLFYLLKNILIGVFLGGGAFNSADVNLTAMMLGIFSLSIPTESLSHLLARGFYSLKNSITPVLVGLGGLALAVVFGYVFSRFMGLLGLAWGFLVGSVIKTVILYVLLQLKSKNLR